MINQYYITEPVGNIGEAPNASLRSKNIKGSNHKTL